MSKKKVQILLSIILGWLSSSQLSAQNFQLQEDWWHTDGSVEAIVEYENTVYIGGSFSRVGPKIYNGTGVSTTSGIGSSDYDMPNGTVNIAVPDGIGGWFIGGNFNSVGGQPRNNIAHLNAAGQVTNWNPDANSSVETMLLSGGTLYVGGVFTQIGGQTRNRIAALSTATGLATTWNPNSAGVVNSLAINGTTLYVGGAFTTIGGQSRNRIAALSTTTGSATTWNPNSNNQVMSVLISGTTLYVGGFFTSVGGQTRNGIAAISTATGLATPLWNPNASGSVRSMALSGTTLYVGGSFTSIGGQTRNNIAALSTTNGLATTWNPNSDGVVLSMQLTGTTLYVGGFFTTIGGNNRNYAAALNTASNFALAWNPNPSSTVETVAFFGSTVYLGGSYDIMGGVNRANFAALDANTGIPIVWNPSCDNSIECFYLEGNILYVGGDFATLGGVSRSMAGAFNLTTKTVTAWNPGVTGFRVYAITGDATNIYLGGGFSAVGNLSRQNIAAVSLTTGAPTSWNPGASANSVLSLLVYNNVLYVGGWFSALAGQPRNGTGAFNLPSGILNAWNPSGYGVYQLEAFNGLIYAGGSFNTIGGQSRNLVAALDPISGLAAPWNPGYQTFEGGVYSAEIANGIFYGGGDIYLAGGIPRNGLAACDGNSGSINSFDPNISGAPYSILAAGTKLYVGGNIYTTSNANTRGLAVFDNGCLNPGCIGCTDPLATNYDETATQSGPCFYCVATPPPCVVQGSEAYTAVLQNDPFCCTNSWDGICQSAYDLLNDSCSGCTNPGALNFDANATSDDGSCIVCGSVTYPPCVDLLSTAFADVVANDTFCCNTAWDSICQNAYNLYNGSCGGCTDDVAINYNPNALFNDGSCNYCQAAPPVCVDLTSEAYYAVLANDAFCCNTGWDSICQNAYNALSQSCYGCTNPIAVNYDPNALVDNGSCLIYGCTDPAACNYNPAANTDNGECVIANYYETFADGNFTANPAWSGDTGAWTVVSSADAGGNSSNSNTLRLNAPAVSGSQYLSTTFSNWQNEQEWSFWIGRRDSVQLNANFMSVWLFANNTNLESPTITGYRLLFAREANDFFYGVRLQKVVNGVVTNLTNEGNYISFSGLSDISWQIRVTRNYYGLWTLQTGSWPYETGNGASANDCMNFDGTISSVVDNSISISGTGRIGIVAVHTNVPSQQAAVEFDNLSILTNTVPSGCINDSACNYTPGALIDDGSCTYPGCLDPTACNYDAAAGCDDGSCVFGPANDQCAGAILLTVGAAATSTTNATSCVNGTNPSCGGTQVQDIWYRFVYAGGNVTVTASGGTLATKRVAIWSACGGTQLGCQTGASASVTLACPTLTSGQTYFIQAGGQNGTTGTFNIQVTQTAINGCTDPLASNFNACATNNTGCIYPGCTNPLACNYNPAANQDDGSCQFVSCTGCTNPTACNYNSGATIDDGSCTLPGCTDSSACNFNAIAGCSDGSCTYPGCTDPTACNYNAAAGCSGITCIYETYFDTFGDGNLTANPGWAGDTGSWQIAASADAGTNSSGSQTLRLNHPVNETGVQYLSVPFNNWQDTQEWSFWLGRRTQAYAANNNTAFWLCADNSNLEAANINGYRIFIGDNSAGDEHRLERVNNGVPTTLVSGFDVTNGLTDFSTHLRVTRSQTGVWILYTSTLPTAAGQGPTANECLNTPVVNGAALDNSLSLEAMTHMGIVSVHTNGAAARTAVEFDNLKITTVNLFLGCNSPDACNYDPAALLDDGSCIFPGCNDPGACNFNPTAGCNDGSCDFSSCAGCTDPVACNYSPVATLEDGSCAYPGCTNPLACNYDDSSGCDDGSCAFPGCTDPTACNFNSLAGCDDGSCDFGVCSGCMDITACNFNALATLDDGSCVYPGCTDAGACNFDLSAGCDDGSCDFSSCLGCIDPFALNYNPLSLIDDGSCQYTDPFNVNLLFPGQGFVCAGLELTFQVFSFAPNPSDFTYLVQFSDGTPELTLTQAQLLANPFLIHQFEFNSCGEVSEGGVPNAYSVSITAMDGNGDAVAFSMIDNIYVNGPDELAQTEIVATPASLQHCTSEPVTFAGLSFGYILVDATGCSESNSVSFYTNAPEVTVVDQNLEVYPPFSSMLFEEPGTFTVGVVQTGLCMTDLSEITVEITEPVGKVSLWTEVGIDPIENMQVNLFTHQNQNMIFNDFTVQSDAEGLAVFDDLPAGLYLARAIPIPTLPGQSNLVSTFSNEVFDWLQAEIIVIGCQTHFKDTIHLLQPGFSSAFPGQASGRVLYMDLPGMGLEGGSAGIGSSVLEGDPIPGVPVVLQRDTIAGNLETGYTVQGYQLTNANGEYAFFNLPEADYRLYVDIPGLPMAETHLFTVTNEALIFQFLNFYVDPEDAIYTSDYVSVDEFAENEELHVYPNPFRDFVNIAFDLLESNGAIQLSLTDATGKMIVPRSVRRFDNAFFIDLSNQSSGLYFYQISSPSYLYRGKLIKLN